MFDHSLRRPLQSLPNLARSLFLFTLLQRFLKPATSNHECLETWCVTIPARYVRKMGRTRHHKFTGPGELAPLPYKWQQDTSPRRPGNGMTVNWSQAPFSMLGSWSHRFGKTLMKTSSHDMFRGSPILSPTNKTNSSAVRRKFYALPSEKNTHTHTYTVTTYVDSMPVAAAKSCWQGTPGTSWCVTHCVSCHFRGSCHCGKLVSTW